MLLRSVALLALVACTGPGSTAVKDTDPSASTGQSGTSTGTPTTGEQVAVACEPTDHAQVFRCAAEREVAGPLTWSWTPTAGGFVRVAESDADTVVHQTLVWGLKADTAYTVSATLPSGDGAAVEVQSGSLPPELQGIVRTTGSSDHGGVMIPNHCGNEPGVVMVDPDGDVVWHFTYGLAGVAVTGFHFTERGTLLSVLGGEFVREHSLDGTELVAMRRGVDFDEPLHHDLYGSADGRNHLMFGELISEPSGDYVMDGVHVFEGTTLLGSWHLADHIPIDPTWDGAGGPPSFWEGVWPGSTDYAHGNAIEVEADGTWTMSFRLLDAVMSVVGDLDAPDFGEVRWTLTGEDTSAVASDFEIVSSNGATTDLDYSGQHNANLDEDGKLLLFDNRTGIGGNSRVLVMELDQTAGTADITEAYDLGVYCDVQGAAQTLSNGHRVGTCAVPDVKTVYEFAPGAADPVWTLTAACPTWKYQLNRAQPVLHELAIP